VGGEDHRRHGQVGGPRTGRISSVIAMNSRRQGADQDHRERE
jgi:hypothetical protein